ncbi:hypothetical protein ABZT17_14335 [Streptomyces sp. NPDC005648]|uniref:hypothetical protein n=1 Tax=Streptomyces sp. NPDC005648 TaxID=3157044 RepID=UPI0033A06DAF
MEATEETAETTEETEETEERLRVAHGMRREVLRDAYVDAEEFRARGKCGRAGGEGRAR